MSDEILDDGETMSGAAKDKLLSADGSGLPENMAVGTARLDPFAKAGEDPKKCPKTCVPMYSAGNLRVALTNGNVYTFPAGKCVYVQKRDEHACAGKGAAVMDAAAIDAAAQAEADALELKQLREEKAARIAKEQEEALEKAKKDAENSGPSSADKQNADAAKNVNAQANKKAPSATKASTKK